MTGPWGWLPFPFDSQNESLLFILFPMFSLDSFLNIDIKSTIIARVWLLWRYSDMRPHKIKEIRFPVQEYNYRESGYWLNIFPNTNLVGFFDKIWKRMNPIPQNKNGRNGGEFSQARTLFPARLPPEMWHVKHGTQWLMPKCSRALQFY